MPPQTNQQQSTLQIKPYQIPSTTSGIVSSFMQPAQELAGALGIQPPQQIPAEATPASMLQDIQKIYRKSKRNIGKREEKKHQD
jgi:hypothetical protein